MTLDHVAIAVRKIREHLPLYRTRLGIPLEGMCEFKKYGVRIASLKLKNARVELLEPLGKKSVLTKFLKKRGEALHHVAFKTRGLKKTVAALKRHGLTWINETPRRGLHNTRICFLHPSCTRGILLEFVEY